MVKNLKFKWVIIGTSPCVVLLFDEERNVIKKIRFQNNNEAREYLNRKEVY